MKVKLLATINFISFFATVFVNGLANALPINGITTGEISDLFPNLFTPIGFTFSIWGLIYLLLLGFSIYQMVNAWKGDGSVVKAIGPFFILSSAANCCWILAWHHYQIPLSWSLMLVLLCSLIVIYLRVRRGINPNTSGVRRFVQIPFSIYLGWITVATIANTAILLTNLEWDLFGIDPRFWTLIVLWAGVTIASRVLEIRGDYYFVGVVVWAYFGIVMKRISVQGSWTDWVVIGCLVGMSYLLIVSLLKRFNRS